MRKAIALLVYILLSVLLIGAVFHFFTALPGVVDTTIILLIISGLILVMSFIGLKLSDQKNTYRSILFISVCSFFFFIYDGFIGFSKNDIVLNSDGNELAASLYLPSKKVCPCPGVVFVHGSGPMTRNEYRYFAKKFAKKGIISLIYDKRGTGGSRGYLYSGGYNSYAKDAANVFEYLTSIETVSAKGFIGFSEGEWVIPMAYSFLKDKPDFMVIVGASGLSPAGQVNEEIEIRLREKGFSDEEISEALDINEAVYNFQRKGIKKDSLLSVLSKRSDQPLVTEAEDIPTNEYELGEYADYEWWRGVMDIDPKGLWEKIDPSKINLLFIKGELDKSYAGRAEERIRSFFSESVQSQVEFRQFKNADHMMLEWPLGERVPPPVFTDGYIKTLIEWIMCKPSAKSGLIFTLV